MGDELLEWVKGGTCLRCQNVLYYKNETPKYIEVVFEGIEVCGWLPDPVPPPNGKFLLIQNPGSPCSWHYITATLQIFYWIRLGSTLLQAIVWEREHTPPFHFGWRPYFQDTINAECQVHFVNEADCTFTRWWAKNGTGQVHFPAGQNIAYYLAMLLYWEKYVDLLCEYWWYHHSLANICVVRLARQRDHTNILVKWDRSHYDQDIMTES